LLSGLLRCGRCGRKMHVLYSGRRGEVARYGCSGGRELRGSSSCLSVGSLRTDGAVVEQVLEAIEPVGIEATLKASEQAALEDQEKRHCVELALERARYEAKRAQRQFDAVEPENRLVAAELEGRWNGALVQVTELEGRLRELTTQTAPVSDEQKRRLLEMGRDFEEIVG
jgi:Recombinase zinc beta ribbon domain